MLARLKPIVFFLVVGSVAGYFVYKEVTRVGKPGVINVGQQAPDFKIKDQSGREVKLSDYRGKVVFLNFWGTFCVPCIAEMPEMEIMHNAFKDRKFQMIAISIDTNWKEVNEFYKDKNLTLPTFLDPGHQVANLYKVFKFPETFLIDGNGYVVKHTWQENWANPKHMDYVESLIQREEARATSPDQNKTQGSARYF
jgi:cytochrome c biogenesis protein CcmG/thiol:disulfide interchange protein DsbE